MTMPIIDWIHMEKNIIKSNIPDINPTPYKPNQKKDITINIVVPYEHIKKTIEAIVDDRDTYKINISVRDTIINNIYEPHPWKPEMRYK